MRILQIGKIAIRPDQGQIIWNHIAGKNCNSHADIRLNIVPAEVEELSEEANA